MIISNKAFQEQQQKCIQIVYVTQHMDSTLCSSPYGAKHYFQMLLQKVYATLGDSR